VSFFDPVFDFWLILQLCAVKTCAIKTNTSAEQRSLSIAIFSSLVESPIKANYKLKRNIMSEIYRGSEPVAMLTSVSPLVLWRYFF